MMSNRVQIEYVLTLEELQRIDEAMNYGAHKSHRVEVPFGNPYQWPFGLLILFGIFYRLFTAIQMLPIAERIFMYIYVAVPWALIVCIFGVLGWKIRQSMRTNPTTGHPIRFDISEKGVGIETRLTQFFAQWAYIENVKWCPVPAGFLIKSMSGTFWIPGAAFKTPELLDLFVSLVNGAGVQFEEMPTN